MGQFIVCKVKESGQLVAGTPPLVHQDYTAAKAEAERLAAMPSNAEARGFLIFKAIARSERVPVTTPVQTIALVG